MPTWALDMALILRELYPDPIHGRSQLAKAIGADPSQVTKWWNGDRRPGPANQAKLAQLAKLVTF